MDPIKEFSRTLLSLENCIVPKERLLNTPSRQDGVGRELEVNLRLAGCECIQTAGLLLKLPQVAMATAQVLFQRFYYAKSFIKYSLQPMAMACIFLAAKIEEDCRRIRDVINVFHHLRQKFLGKPVVPMDYMGEEYFKLKATVIKYERFLLKELGFCVHIKHSHKLIITYLQMLEMDKNTQLAQRCWNYMNDSLRTNVFVRFSPETIACSCIYLGARQLKIPLPQSPPWWLLFDADFEDIEAVSLELLALYQRPRVPLEVVERDITKLKEEYQKKQVEIKEVKLKKTEPEVDQSKKGLLPTPDTVTVSAAAMQSSQGPPSQPPSKSKIPPKSPSSRPRTIPKSYTMTSPSSSPPRPSGLHAPPTRSTRSVSPLVTHAQSAKDLTPPSRSVPSPIRWQERSPASEDSGSESGTPSPLHRGHTPRAYRPVVSPIVLSEGESDSAARSPSPLSLVRRENGVQEKQRDEINDRKVRKNRHRHGNREDHRDRRERRRLRSRSNETLDRHESHRRKHHHRKDKTRERRRYISEKRDREREREEVEFGYGQRSRKLDHFRR
jgi:hypothetical protein